MGDDFPQMRQYPVGSFSFEWVPGLNEGGVGHMEARLRAVCGRMPPWCGFLFVCLVRQGDFYCTGILLAEADE